MKLQSVKLVGYRNFRKADIKFCEKTLLIGANDVGKSNLLRAIRILLDKSISDTDISPVESDFHVSNKGVQSTEFLVQIILSDITEDAVLSRLKGWISDDGSCTLAIYATLSDLKYQIYIGHSEDALEEIDGRSYLKYIHFRFIQSYRDLSQIIKVERRNLIKTAKNDRNTNEETIDVSTESDIAQNIMSLNSAVGSLSYVHKATQSLNGELNRLSYHNSDIDLKFEAGPVALSSFIEQLNLRVHRGNKSIAYGGDGRNNQIAIALWKVRSEKEHDHESEAVIYSIEEPEAHLHPHQQRKLAEFLVNELHGQVIVTTHSPQITAEFSPNSIIRLYEVNGNTKASNNGCSEVVKQSWDKFGYRMSVIPAEAFFSDAVLLVEGPSEELFYKALARSKSIDLDYYNISILSVSGIGFKVYCTILNAMGIKWILRTDNDICKVPKITPPKWRLAGINRVLDYLGKQKLKHRDSLCTPIDAEIIEIWKEVSKFANNSGMYLSKWDLEHDISEFLSKELMTFAKVDDVQEAIEYLQGKKATRMGEFLIETNPDLSIIPQDDQIMQPLLKVLEIASNRK